MVGRFPGFGRRTDTGTQGTQVPRPAPQLNEAQLAVVRGTQVLRRDVESLFREIPLDACFELLRTQTLTVSEMRLIRPILLGKAGVDVNLLRRLNTALKNQKARVALESQQLSQVLDSFRQEINNTIVVLSQRTKSGISLPDEVVVKVGDRRVDQALVVDLINKLSDEQLQELGLTRPSPPASGGSASPASGSSPSSSGSG